VTSVMQTQTKERSYWHLWSCWTWTPFVTFKFISICNVEYWL